ncbi:MAG: 4-hydroxy-tetrahydrodipicolinate synthase [Erysipelotrichales bacterium]|nr:4-hydroxy-tetrahydrodipicolinate synthase [Erysipelotrichales bacterium]
MKKIIFKGCSTALITPFKKDLSVDYQALEVLLERQLNNGIKSLTILGTTSEYPTLKEAEMLEIISFVLAKVNKRATIICGTGRNNTEECLEFSKKAVALGVDALLIVTPYYNRTSETGLIKHFTYLADNLKKPVILYNVPGRTGMTIPLAVYQTLSKHPNIYGTKEASGDLALIKELKQTCPDFAVYSGNDDQINAVLELGGEGVISVLSNVLPQETENICQNFFDFNKIKAQEIQGKFNNLIENLFIETNPIPVKFALSHLGLCENILRMPLVPLASQYESGLIKALKELK